MLEGLISSATAAGKGPVDRSRVWSDADAVAALGAARPLVEPAVVRAEPLDAVTGGCVLSAAELDSSKQYLQRPDGEWAIAYQVCCLLHTKHRCAFALSSTCNVVQHSCQ